jgi:nucleotide-binding universal stress UspA family protein
MVAEALGFALRYGAELLAIGAVAHSRLRKMPFGGVTRSLIEPPRLPLLLAR